MRNLLIYLFILLSLISIGHATCSYNENEYHYQAKIDCDKNPGKLWSCELNRCTNTEKTVALRKDMGDCAKIIDASEQDLCHAEVASNHSDIKSIDIKESISNPSIKNGVAQAAYLGLRYVQDKGSKGTPKCTSRSIAKITAAAGVMFNYLIVSGAKKAFESISEDYETSDSDEVEKQRSALEKLAQTQEVVQESAAQAKKYYLYNSTGWLAVTGTAALEVIGILPACTSKNETGTDTVSSGSPQGLPIKSPSTSGFLTKAFGSSTGHLVIGAIAASYNLSLYRSAIEQEKTAKENVEKTKKLLKIFSASVAGYCTNSSRSDIDNPNCYCYNNDGSEDQNKSNSETCQKLWHDSKKSYFVKAGNYAELLKNPKIKICMTKSGQIDKGCKCKQLLSKTDNKNACMKVPMRKNSIGIVQSGLSAKDLATNGNLLFQGTNQVGSLSTETLGRNAAKQKRNLDKLIGKLDKKRAIAKKTPINDLILSEAIRYSKSFPKKDLKNFAIKKNNVSPTISSFIDNDTEAIDQIETASRKVIMSGGSGLKRKSGTTNDETDYSDNGIHQGTNLSSTEEFEVKNKHTIHDINNNKSVTIFKIISSRYMKTAYKKLFPAEEVTTNE